MYLHIEAGKLKNGLNPIIKATTSNLSILLSKLKTHVARKKEIYSKERYKDRKKPLNVLQCVKNICRLWRIKKNVKVLKNKKRKRVVGCGGTHL